MAAGRQNYVSRRRDSYDDHYRSEATRYRNGARGAEFDRDYGRYRGSNGASKVVGRGDQTRKTGGVIELPPEKKRRFSPIIWDPVEKELELSSKAEVTSSDATFLMTGTTHLSVHGATTVDSCVAISTPASYINHVAVEGVVVEIPFVKSSSSAPGSAESTVTDARCSPANSMSHEQFESNDNQQERNVEIIDEGSMHARTISMSRWALEGNSPATNDGLINPYLPQKKEYDHMDVSEAAIDREMSSPECGEFIREDSAGPKSSSSRSDNEKCGSRSSSGYEDSDTDSDRSGSLDIDENHDGDTDDSRSNSSSEDEGEQMLVTPARSTNMLEGCRSVFEYEKLNKINEGTYGVVYRAKDKKTGEIVALKKVKMTIERDGFPLSALREMNILLSLHHPSVVNVKEVVMDDLDSVFMVMEYMEHDLKGVMEVMKEPFTVSEVKCLMLQLLEGVHYLHDNWVLHRDLKSSNILLNNKGELKLCDLGLSRQYGEPLKPYTPLVVTLWYRAPEILLGAKHYSTAIDMWSAGCIMAELLSKEPLFKGKAEVDQLDKIFKTLGTPNEMIWPGFSKLPGSKVKFVKQPYNLLRKKFPATSFTGSPALSDSGFDLLNRLLTYDPNKRITSEEALNHAWFSEVPLPKSKDFMPTFPAVNAKDRSFKPSKRA